MISLAKAAFFGSNVFPETPETPGRRARSQGDQKPHCGAEATRYFAHGGGGKKTVGNPI